MVFIQNAETRNMLGFNVRTSQPNELAEAALKQAVNTRNALLDRTGKKTAITLVSATKNLNLRSLPSTIN